MKSIVSHAAVTARINRTLNRLGHPRQRLCKSRPLSVALDAFGSHYLVSGGDIVRTHIDVAHFARELGVLHPHEELAA